MKIEISSLAVPPALGLLSLSPLYRRSFRSVDGLIELFGKIEISWLRREGGRGGALTFSLAEEDFMASRRMRFHNSVHRIFQTLLAGICPTYQRELPGTSRRALRERK